MERQILNYLLENTRVEIFMKQRKSKFKVGDKVILADNETTRKDHRENPKNYPKPGTRGVVLDESIAPFVQWEKGSTSKDDRWAVCSDDLILAD